jgi:hypothetical protein
MRQGKRYDVAAKILDLCRQTCLKTSLNCKYSKVCTCHGALITKQWVASSSYQFNVYITFNDSKQILDTTIKTKIIPHYLELLSRKLIWQITISILQIEIWAWYCVSWCLALDSSKQMLTVISMFHWWVYCYSGGYLLSKLKLPNE